MVGEEGKGERGKGKRVRGEDGRYAPRLHPFPSYPFLVSVQLRDGAVHVFDLGEYSVFELRSVGDEGVERGDAPDGRVEVFEQLFGDARGQLRAEAVRARVLVGDDDLVR